MTCKRPLCKVASIGANANVLPERIYASKDRKTLLESIRVMRAGFEAIETRITAAEIKLGEVDSKLDPIEDELAFLDGKITATKIGINAFIGQVNALSGDIDGLI